jgi:hypothetical protein
MKMPRVQHGDTASKINELTALDIDHAAVLGVICEDWMNLADPTGHGSDTTLHNGTRWSCS